MCHIFCNAVFYAERFIVCFQDTFIIFSKVLIGTQIPEQSINIFKGTKVGFYTTYK